MSEELKAALARIACLEGEIAKRDARIMGLESQYQRDVWGLNNEGDPIGGEPAGGYANDNARLRAELAALKAQDTVGEVVGWYRLDRPYEMTPYPSVCATWHRLGAPVAPLNAAPVQQVSVPDGATLILGDTGRKDLDRLIDRLMSSDPDFEDCTAAAALLRRLFMEEISGPKGHATWKDAAVAERLRRVSMRPQETVVAMAREGLVVYSGPNMNEHKVCAEIVRLADISDTAMLAAAPAAPAADASDVLDQAMYTLISIGYHENSGLVHELRQALAAHSAKGVA